MTAAFSTTPRLLGACCCAICDYGRFVVHVPMNTPGWPGTGVTKHLADFASAGVTMANCAPTTPSRERVIAAMRVFMVMAILKWGVGVRDNALGKAQGVPFLKCQ